MIPQRGRSTVRVAQQTLYSKEINTKRYKCEQKQTKKQYLNTPPHPFRCAETSVQLRCGTVTDFYCSAEKVRRCFGISGPAEALPVTPRAYPRDPRTCLGGVCGQRSPARRCNPSCGSPAPRTGGPPWHGPKGRVNYRQARFCGARKSLGGSCFIDGADFPAACCAALAADPIRFAVCVCVSRL